MLWGGEWWTNGNSDGDDRAHLLYENGRPVMFNTRREIREYINKRYAYIRTRKDLRAPPHGWRMPKPVKIKVEIIILDTQCPVN